MMKGIILSIKVNYAVTMTSFQMTSDIGAQATSQ